MTARQAGLLGLLAMLWGASYALIKYALEDFSPAMIVFLRTLLAAAVLYGLLRLRGGGDLEELRRRPGQALRLGALAVAAPFLLIAYGELEVPSGLTAVLIASSPLWVAALAPLVDPSEKVVGRQAAGMLMGFAGVALLVGVETVQSLGELLGAAAIVGAAAFYALASFTVKRTYRGVPALTGSFVSVVAGCLLTLPVAAATPPTEAPGVRALVALAILGVFGTAFAFVVFYRLIAELGAGRAALVGFLIPPLSLAYGALLLDEAITVAALGGLALILAGVALASRAPPAPPAPPRV